LGYHTRCTIWGFFMLLSILVNLAIALGVTRMMALGLAGAGICSFSLPGLPGVVWLAIFWTLERVGWAMAGPAGEAMVADEARKVFDVTMEARAKAFEPIKPGIRADEVDRKVLSIIEDAGFGKNILHRTGHGFGITGHEPPWVALGSEHVLTKNMVISIEPGIYIEGLGGFRHSDTVLVTENGCVALTEYTDSLDELTLKLPCSWLNQT